MWRDDQRFFSTVLGTLTLIAAACAPAASPATGGSPEKPVVRKILTLADSYEPKAITETFVEGHQTSGNNAKAIIHDTLLRTPAFQLDEPLLAAEIPSIERGTWKINPDGSMETIWRLRPNVRWHDGQPFTSADLVFTYSASHDTDIAGVSVSAADRLMDSVQAPDPSTFVVRWKGPYAEAYRTGVGDILPRHLAEEIYAKDKSAFANMALFSTQFVGLGPYRMVRWEQGSVLEAARFDDYYLGRPPLDTIYMKFFGDANTLVANALSGAVDAVLSGASGSSVSLDQALEVKKRWQGTGNQVLTSQTGNVLWTEAQFNPEYARPPGVAGNVLVRRALLHAIDRQVLADTMTNGLSPVADSYFMFDEPRRPDLERYIEKYAYDATRATQLLAEAGWVRGGDGILARASDGQRMEFEFWARAGATDKVATIITDDWKKIGVASTPYIIPTARRTDREYEAKRPGFLCCVRVSITTFNSGKLHQRQIPTAATNWNGINYGGYVNPRTDALLDQLNSTIDPRARLPLEQKIVQEYTSDVAILPMWWEIFPMLLADGVKGPRPNFVGPTANIFEWDRQ